MAAPLEWRIEFYSGGAWVQLPDMQALNIFRGRRLQIDDYSIDTMSIESEFPSNWTVTPKVGDKIRACMYRAANPPGLEYYDAFWGNIRDVKIDYGMVPNDDAVTIDCEGIQADWGRAQLNNFALAEAKTDDQVLALQTVIGLNVAQFFGRSTGSAQVFTGNALELLNLITRTEEARMKAGSNAVHGGTVSLYWFGRNTPQQTTFYFNDGTGTPYLYQLKYEKIEFRSSADNYYNSVTITPAGLAAQTATLGVTPLYAWQKNTNDYTTNQAQDHARWVLNNFQSKDSTLATITFTDVQQIPTTYPGDGFNFDILSVIGSCINTNGRIYFRGQTLNTIIEGVNISATPNQTRVTLYMSGQDTNAYLILDNAIYGKLDTNKLGF